LPGVRCRFVAPPGFIDRPSVTVETKPEDRRYAMKTTCQKCRYYYALPDKQDKGECRRYPPKMILLTAPPHQSVLKDVFVYVSSCSFCGEYAPFQNS
jgi:hypothetical protein